METPAIKLKYETIGSEAFAMLMQKISNTQTNNKAASHINHIIKEVERVREHIKDEYLKEIREGFAKRDADGKIDLIDKDGNNHKDQPNWFDVEDAKMAELNKATEEFHQREAVINWRPLTPSTLEDVNLSAREINLLGDLYSEIEVGPGVPTNIAQFRK